MGRGFLLNNSYIYASKKERDEMDKSKYYRQSGVCLFMLSVAFLVDGLAVILSINGLYALFYVLIAISVIYAIVSSIKLSK